MKLILLHGLHASPADKWYPWLAKEMAQQDIEFFAPVYRILLIQILKTG